VSRPLLARAIAACVRALAWTWRVERPPWPVAGPCVAAFWHGDQLAMIALHRGMGLVGVASRSRDGDLLAGVLAALGFAVVRGSSSRGGFEVLRACERAIAEGRSPALAVDGPRGPHHHVQPGAAVLARRADVPVVCGVVLARGLRLPTWDRFLIPWPFARVRIAYRVARPDQVGSALSQLTADG
jgi:lysophospholipid acyltransferase (LPLAT)-like uncharacterized protein